MKKTDMEEKKQKILIVDDTPLNTKILGEILCSDYQVIVATNGIKALEIANQESPPDLILLDIMMPDMDGYEVCRRLKSNARTQEIPVIFISAKNELSDEIHGFELGAVDFISKPFSMPVVNMRIKTHLTLKKKSDLLEQLCCIDGLTNIANRRRFNEYLKQEWRRSCRNKSHLSLIFADVDFFKKYNDCYGHHAGDECLINIANILKNSLGRSTDLVARYGGEEFIIILPETDMQASQSIAKQIKHNVEQANIAHICSSIASQITLSMGVASTIPMDSTRQDELVKAADFALYEAKNNGRNQIKCFTGKMSCLSADKK